MDIWPAIDLMSGSCVRLIQGQYHKKISYEIDPAKQAKDFYDAGARFIHVVDLDGAKVGKPINIEAIKSIVQTAGVKVEVGGGIRDEQDIQTMLDIGVERVILGTNAASKFEWFSDMANKFPGKLVLGIDARGSKVAIKGWTQEGPSQLWDFAEKAANIPIAAIIYTDISKDGMMSGPNFERTKSLIDASNHDVVASGGVTEISDVIRFKEFGAAGVIIGRALYEEKMDLAEAIKASK